MEYVTELTGQSTKVERLTLAAQMHRDCKRIGGLRQIIAQHTVQRRDNSFELGGGIDMAQRGRHGAQCKIDASADCTRDAANAFIDHRSSAIDCSAHDCAAKPSRSFRYVGMHRLDEPSGGGDRIDHDGGHAAKISNVIANYPGHRLS